MPSDTSHHMLFFSAVRHSMQAWCKKWADMCAPSKQLVHGHIAPHEVYSLLQKMWFLLQDTYSLLKEMQSLPRQIHFRTQHTRDIVVTTREYIVCCTGYIRDLIKSKVRKLRFRFHVDAPPYEQPNMLSPLPSNIPCFSTTSCNKHISCYSRCILWYKLYLLQDICFLLQDSYSLLQLWKIYSLPQRIYSLSQEMCFLLHNVYSLLQEIYEHSIKSNTRKLRFRFVSMGRLILSVAKYATPSTFRYSLLLRYNLQHVY